MATLVVPPVPFSPRDDAAQLYRAFKGNIRLSQQSHSLGCSPFSSKLLKILPSACIGVDAETVINILAHRDATQRALIQQEYQAMYSEDLLKRLSTEHTGKMENSILLWMHDPAGRDAIVIKQAFLASKLEAVNEVICSRTPSQIQLIRQHYHAKFGVHLEHDIDHHASGDHKKLLISYITIPRSEGPEVDKAMADNDAKTLYKAGEKKLGTDEKTFIHMFSERSRAQLAAINVAYHSTYGHPLKKAVKKETSGKFAHALLTILKCADNPAKFFAKVLHKAMKGLGTDDGTLIRVIVTRTEIDMQYIKAEYRKKYKKTLNDAVYSETSGNYRAFLLTLLGPNQ